MATICLLYKMIFVMQLNVNTCIAPTSRNSCWLFCIQVPLFCDWRTPLHCLLLKTWKMFTSTINQLISVTNLELVKFPGFKHGTVKYVNPKSIKVKEEREVFLIRNINLQKLQKYIFIKTRCISSINTKLLLKFNYTIFS